MTAKPEAYFYIGKFQPFHNGHLNVVLQMIMQAKKDNAKVFLFSTNKHNKDTHLIPKDIKSKLLNTLVKERFPEINFNMVNSLYDATKVLSDHGIQNAKIMAGNDRLKEYTKAGNKGMNGVTFSVSLIDRTKDNISGTAVRSKILLEDASVNKDIDKVYSPTKLETIKSIIIENATSKSAPAATKRAKRTPAATKRAKRVGGRSKKRHSKKRRSKKRRYRRSSRI